MSPCILINKNVNINILSIKAVLELAFVRQITNSSTMQTLCRVLQLKNIDKTLLAPARRVTCAYRVRFPEVTQFFVFTE